LGKNDSYGYPAVYWPDFCVIFHAIGIFSKDMAQLTYEIGIHNVNKWTTPAVFEFGMVEACSTENIIAGFEACGLFPLNVDWVDEKQHKLKVGECLNDSVDGSTLDMATATHEQTHQVLKL